MNISFIIPIYKVEAFLPACLDSILSQKGDDFEVLPVDDGSPDGCGKIIDEYAQKDARVRPLHQKNAGVSAARNLGLDNARGDFIVFIDGDDQIVENGLETLRAALSEGCDITYFTFLYQKEGQPRSRANPSIKTTLYAGDEIRTLQQNVMYTRFDLPDAFDYGSCCGRLYRRAFLCEHQLRLPSGIARSEDVLFNLQCVSHAKRARLVAQPLYVYRLHAQSSVHRYDAHMDEELLPSLSRCEQALAELYGDRADMRARFDCRCISDLTGCLRQGVCSAQNPARGEERQRQLNALLSRPLFARAIRDCDESLLSRENALVLSCCRAKSEKALDAVFRREDRSAKIHDLYMRLGLYKVKRALINALGR